MSDLDQSEPSTVASWRSRAAPLLIPLALVVVLLGPHLAGQRSLAPTDQLFAWQPWAAEAPAGLSPTHRAPFSDNFDAVFPGREEATSRVRSGDWPLWTSMSGGGVDLTTNIGNALAAPSFLVALATPGWYAPALIKALELMAAWGFVFLFLRRVGVSRWPAGFGGAVFALSGFQVVWVNWPHTRVAALVAGTLWAFDRVVERVAPSRVAVAALLLCATVMEGFPAVAAVGVGSVAVLLAVRWIHLSTGWLDATKRLAGAAGAAILGVGLTAMVTIPFASHLGGLGLDRAVPADASLARGLGTLLAPNALGPAEQFFGPLNYVELVGYLGPPAAVVVAVAAVALLTRGRPDHRGLLLGLTAVGGAVMVLYSYGVEPLYDTFRTLPVLSTNPAMRVKSAGLLWLALAAGLGLDALVRWRLGPVSRWLCTAATVAVSAIGTAYLAGFATRAPSELSDYVSGEIIRAVVVLTVTALAVVVLLRPSWPKASQIAVGVVIVATMVDAVVWVLPYWPRSEPSEFYPETRAHEFLAEHLGDDRFSALGLSFFPGTSEFYGLRSVTGHVFFRPEWTDLLEAAGATMRSPTFASFEDPASASSPVLDRLGVAYWADPEGVARCAPTGAPVTTFTANQRSVRLTTTGPGVRGVTVVPGVDLPAGTRLSIRAKDASGSDASGELTVGAVAAGTAVMIPAVGLERLDGDLDIVVRSSADLGTLAAAPTTCLAPDDGLELVHTSGSWIYRRTDALDRFRFAADDVVVEDPSERVQLLRSGTVPDDTVVLSAEPSTQGDPTSTGSVIDVDEEDADHVVVEVDSSGPGFLVVADAIGDGWTATVDGEPAQLIEADHAAAAVSLSGGTQTVELQYVPRGLRAGLAISAASALIVMVLFGWALWRRRSRRAQAGA
jgi:hypothetical protein